MPISLLFGCCQIETCTPDLAATRDYLTNLLGAVPVEQDLARQIAALLPGTGYAVDHLECGGAVFQINQPARGMTFAGQKSIHEAYLERGGSCVTNLNFYVDDIVHARNLLIELGAPIHIAGPSTAVAALTDYGPDNTRPGGAERPFLFMGTRHLIGFDLEIMEPNFLRLGDQSAQFPAYVETRPAVSGGLVLHRLVAVVPDLGCTLQAITRILAPASRSKPYRLRQGAEGRSFRIGLGGLEIEYCQPTEEGGAIARHLRAHGPGIAAAVFGCADPHRRCAADPRWQEIAPGADQACDEGTRFHASSRHLTGFDIVMEPLEPRP